MQWAQRIVFGMLVGLVVMVSSLMVYDLTMTKHLTVIVNIDQGADPFETIPQIVSSGDRIISVRQKDPATNSYEIQVMTRKSKEGFLDWLLKSKKVKKATIEEEDDD